MRPLLKWAGGKSKLAAQISAAFDGPCRGVWVEPFLGSASVFLHRRARGEVSDAILSDANPKLVALHVAVRDQVDDVLAELAAMPTRAWEPAYYDTREAFNAGPHAGPLHAARFIWLNRAGFNGLYRENRRGEFNVPIGRYAHLSPPGEAHLREVSELLQGVEIVSSGFADVMRRAGAGDQVYCDPPYVPLNATAAFTAYCKEPFGLDEQQALAQESMRAAFRGAQVVLSNHDLPIVRNELYPETSGFRHVARPQVGRAISREVHTRKAIAEVIASIGPLRHVA
jgi:DNA adenine methylase